MRLTPVLVGLLTLCAGLLAHAKECDWVTPLMSAEAAVAIETIASHLRASDHACATQATQALRASWSSLPGSDGIDARFALREMVIAISGNASYPAESRLAMLRAAAPDPAANGATQATEELQADVRMLYTAGKQFQAEKNIAAWLDTLILAIRLDQKLATKGRRIDAGDLFNLIPDTMSAHQYVDRLATLAELIRSDPVLDRFRSDLAHMTYYNLPAWRKEDNRDVTLDRCRQLLRLTEALSDVKSCYGCSPAWHWRPVLRVGAAYQKLGMTNEARAQTERALQIARSHEDRNSRLAQYRFVLIELLAMQYDRSVIIALADEMRELANSLDTPIALEVRESLPRTLKNWKITP